MLMKTKSLANVTVSLLFFGTLFFTTVSCKKDDDVTEKSLYERLGKTEAITAVVDQFLGNVVADNRINAKFSATVASPTRLAALRTNLIDQICQGTGGPCVYKGKTMAAAHAGMAITQVEFDALAEDLSSALTKLKVTEKEKAELMAIVGPMQSDIVGK
jgi:hemoglobin